MAEPIQGNAQAGTGDGSRQAGDPVSLIDSFAGAGGSEPSAKPASGGGAQGESAESAQPAKLAPWAEQLPPEMRGNTDIAQRLAKFNKIGDVVNAFLDLEKKQAGAVPGTEATPEEVASFWEKAGKPKTAEDYSFAKEPAAKDFAAAAHGANLTSAQADALYRQLQDLGKQQAQTMQEARKSQILEADAALKKEYGGKFAEKIELFTRGCMAAGPDVKTLLYQSGLGGNVNIIKAFISLGELNAESTAARGGGAAAQPLKSVNEGGWYDYLNTGENKNANS
jgi:hypothetical protein